MARLPLPGSDDGQWGQLLNDFLSVEHVNVNDPEDPSFDNNGKLLKAELIAGAQQKSEKGQPNGYAPLDGTAPTGKIPSAYLPPFDPVPDATTASKGLVQLAGDLSGTASAPTVPGLANKYVKAAGGIPETDLDSSVQTKLNAGGGSVSVITTKGDLIAGTGSGGVARLPVGSDGLILTADSASPTGVSWATSSTGGHVIANDGVNLPQQGTLNFTGQGVYIADDAANNATKVTIVNEYLNVTDPRWGAKGDGVTDDAPAIQAAIDAGVGLRSFTIFIPAGVYRCASEIHLNTSASFRILGAGSGPGENGATVLKFDELGPGKYAFNFDPASTYRLEKLTVLGPGSTLTPGSFPAQMDGVLAKNRGALFDVTVSGFASGVVVWNDHQEFHFCDFRGNGYNMNWIESDGLGDHLIDRCFLDTASLASVAVSNGGTIANGRFVQCTFGNAPYAFYRYGGATAPRTTFITGCGFDNCTIDNCGNGVAYDSVGDGGFSAIFEPANETNTWQGPKWPGHPLRAGLEVGQVSNTYWRFGHPLTIVDPIDGPIPAIRAGTITNIKYGWIENELENAVTNGNKLFDQASVVSGIQLGEIGGGSPLASAKKVSSTATDPIQQFDLVENKSGAVLRSTNSANSVVLGVSLQDYSANDDCVYWVSGSASYLKVNNYGTSQIPSDSLLRPDPAHAGGVKAATSWNDGQIIGRALADIPAGSAGLAELFGIGKQ